jgi:hypothetical protein
MFREGKTMNSRKFWLVGTLIVIWIVVVLTSLFAPDLVTGSEQAHTPIAAIITWICGLAATRSVIKIMGRSKGPQQETNVVWIYGGINIAAIWIVAALAAIFSPVNITGSDPTQFPLAVFISPIAAVILTGLVSQLFENRLQN